jgi:hypothetical protein
MAAKTNFEKLKQVRQRTSCDCVIATTAMVSNLSYGEVASCSPVRPGTRGLRSREIRQLLEKTTGIDWSRPEWGRRRNVEQWAVSVSTLVVIARRPWHWRTLHCIAVQQRCIYDPNYRRAIFSCDYDHRHWIVTAVFRPADANRLFAIRKYYANGPSGRGRTQRNTLT